MNDVIHFYETVDEELRFQRNSRRIEFLTSIKALAEHIGLPSNLLELGAGKGAYSFHYAEQGVEVTAIDLTPRNIERINERKAEMENVQLNALVGDASDLRLFDSESFECVLCLGPYYHITDAEVRRKAIAEALRVLRTNGVLAIAYINKFSVAPMLVKKMPSFIQAGTLRKVVNDGYLKGGDPDSFWTDSHYTTPDEVEASLQGFDVTIIDHLAADGISHTIDAEVDRLSEESFKLYAEYHYATCREKSILGMSTHGLVICRKNGAV